MLKSILLFIKAHTVVTVITATVVITAAVATPILVGNYKLDKAVEAKLDLLVSSDFNVENNNDIITEDQNINGVVKEDVQNNEPLTFKIVQCEVVGGTTINFQEDGVGTPDMTQTHMEYRIVPSYDKDFSKWTKDEKEAYDECIKEIAKIAEENYKDAVANEAKAMQDAIIDLQKIMDSYSENYNCEVCNFRYNSYTKKYDGQIFTIEREIISDGEYSTTYNTKISSGETKEYSREEFRESIYFEMIERLENEREYYENNYNIESYNNALSNLNELYHLSD